MTLSEIIWISLGEAVAKRRGIDRLAVEGLPEDISEALRLKAHSDGLQGGVLIRFCGRTGGELLDDGWWLVRKSAKLDMSGVTFIRNRWTPLVLMSSASQLEELEASIGTQVFTRLPNLIDDAEMRVFPGHDHQEYVKLCNRCTGGDVASDLYEARWTYLQDSEKTISLGWAQYLGLSAVLGVPSEAGGGLMPSLSNFETLDRISTFIKERSSPDAAKQQLLEAVEADNYFENKDRYNQAITDFFVWLVDTGSWRVPTDWNLPCKVYRGVKAIGTVQLGLEKNWRIVLDRECWDRLLKPFAKSSKQTLEVRNGHDLDAEIIVPLNDGLFGVYPVSDSFQLCVSALQVGQRVRVPADWRIGVKPRELNYSGEEPILLSCDDLNIKRFLKSPLLVQAKTLDKNIKGTLVNVAASELGIFLFSNGAQLSEEIVQPQVNDSTENNAPELVASMVLKSPGPFSITLLIDQHRVELVENGIKVQERELYYQSNQSSDGSLRIDVTGAESDGIHQDISFYFRDLTNGKDILLKVSVSCSGVPEGDYASYLHLWAASHADRRRYPAKFSNKFCEKLAPLVKAFEQLGGEGKPLFIGVMPDCDDGLPRDFRVLPNGVILDDSAMKIGADVRAISRCTNWKLPEAVKEARHSLWSLLQRLSGDSSFSSIDFTNSQLVAASGRYIAAFDAWIDSDADAAYDALSWIDAFHIVSSTNAGPQTSALIVLPTHPLSLMGIIGLSDLLSPSRSSQGEGLDFYPPLSRLYGMAGPRSWVVRGADSTHEVFRLATPSEHMFKVYERTGSVDDDVRDFLKSNFSLGLPTISLALGTRDVVSVLDDVCALNPAMSSFRVGIVSDPSGSVCEGIFSWFRPSQTEEQELKSPECKDWLGCFPMHLNVYSSSQVIDDWEVEGRVANCSETGPRRLSWYKGFQHELSGMNFSILGELSCGESLDDIGEGRGVVPSLSLYRLGVSFRQDFLLQSAGKNYVETYGSGYLSESYNLPSESGAKVASLYERWNLVLRRNHKPYSYSEMPVTRALENSKFVAIPVSTSSIIQAVSAIDSDSAVWKFEHTEFGVTDSTSGHVILTKKLEMLHQRMSYISRAYEFNFDGVGEIESLLRYMGRAGINTLHTLSDNEKVLLGALSSVAVMRSYESMPRAKPKCNEGAWPVLVMPLDSFARLLEQLNRRGSRPDFLVIEVCQLTDGSFEINIDVLEAKWRTDWPQYGKLSEMHKSQCTSFVEDMGEWFLLDGNAQKRMSTVIFISELITSAIKLRESSTGDAGFSGEIGAAKSLAVTDALLKGNVKITFGDSPTLICVSGHKSLNVNKLFKLKDRSGLVGVMSQKDANEVIKDASFIPLWRMFNPEDPDDGPNPLDEVPDPPQFTPTSPLRVDVSRPGKGLSDMHTPVAVDLSWPPKKNALGLIGQDAASAKVKNKANMCLGLGRRFTDTLFVGPAGVGKSSFARSIASAVLNEEPIFSSGSDVATPGDFISLLVSRGKVSPSKTKRKIGKCIVFIDEIHALSKKTSVFLLSALDDARLATEGGVEYDFSDVVFLGATTDQGRLTRAFLSRMDIIQLNPYSIAELAGILCIHGKRVFGGYELSRDVCEEVAARNRCNPRKSVRSLENDMLSHLFALVPEGLSREDALMEAGRLMTRDAVSEYYESQGVDLNGLDQASVGVLRYLEKSDSVSRDKLRKGLQITNDADFDELIEFLERLGLVATSTNGRSITSDGLRYLKSPIDLRSRI